MMTILKLINLIDKFSQVHIKAVNLIKKGSIKLPFEIKIAQLVLYALTV